MRTCEENIAENGFSALRGGFLIINIKIRPEEQSDHPFVHEVNRLAFGGDEEAGLVEAIRNSGLFIPELSLVAVEDNTIVGHILFSPVTIETDKGSLEALALAPMAVRPDYQRQGIGTALIHQGLDMCRQMDYGIVIVIGHPHYYPRFGFSPARDKGLEAPFPVPNEAFMVLELSKGSLDGIAGTVRYPEAFVGLG